MRDFIFTVMALAVLAGCSAKDGARMSQMPLVGNSDCANGLSVSRAICRDKNGAQIELSTDDPKRYYEYIYKKRD